MMDLNLLFSVHTEMVTSNSVGSSYNFLTIANKMYSIGKLSLHFILCNTGSI